MRPTPLFSIAGIPISISPIYFLMLFIFARGSGLVGGLLIAAGITVALLVHEMGHALVGLYLRQQPAITLHGMGGETSRSRQGRDVEEATVIAMGPAAGLTLGMLTYGVLRLMMASAGGQLLLTPMVFEGLRALLWPCIAWNLFNLLPVWPLDGGKLFRLGTMRLFGARFADRATHGLSIALITLAAIWMLRDQNWYMLILLAMLGSENLQAWRGETSSGVVHKANSHAKQLVSEAGKALSEERFKDATRLAQQARASSQVPLPLLDEIWEILGLATAAQGEHEEALTYLRRAPATARVKRATSACLTALGEEDAMPEVEARWQTGARGRHIGRALIAALGVIAASAAVVFTTTLSQWVF